MESPPVNLALLERALFERPTAFEFFTAVRTLERLLPGRASVGGDGDPAGEVVRFVVNPRLGYPAAEIQALVTPDQAPPRMTVNFMGLTGPSGVLPYAYTEHQIARQTERDYAFGAFLDVFHHRMISLFYRAWKKHRFTVRHETEGEDPLTDHLLDLAGYGLDDRDDEATVPVERLARYAGVLGPEPRSAVGLESLLADWFDVPVEVQQFLGGWYAVTESDQCALDEPGPATRLGGGALVGDEIWDPQGRVRIRVGPLDRARYEAFLPGGEEHETIRQLARSWCHDQFTVELQLVLERDAVPGIRLDAAADGERLGWSAWMCTRERAADGDETVLVLQA